MSGDEGRRTKDEEPGTDAVSSGLSGLPLDGEQESADVLDSLEHSDPEQDYRRGPVHGPAAAVLTALFGERGMAPGDWWPFLVQGEGTELPGGVEALSGFVLNRLGTVYGWWLGWVPYGATGATGERARGVSEEELSTGSGGRGEPEAVQTEEPVGRFLFEKWWIVEEPEREFMYDGEYALARRRLGMGEA